MTNERLKLLIRDTVKEAIRDEMIKLYILLTPRISKKEMKEIEKLYGSPKKYAKDDFVNGSDWLGK